MSLLTIIYIVTPVASIVIALLLIHWAKLSEEARLKEEDAQRRGVTIPQIINDAAIKDTVYHGISGVLDSQQRCQEVTRIVSDIFGQELNKRIEQTTKEVSKKYESIIEKNAKSEEIAWDKYNRAISEKKQTDAVIRSVAEGLLVVDAAGKVVMMNPAAERLLGVSRKDKIGKPVDDSMKQEQLLSLVRDTNDKKEGKEIELFSQNHETSKTIRASSAVIENENGQTVGMVSVLSDITKQKEIDRLKAGFVANVTHELRTPLVSIDKAITFLLSNAGNELSANQQQFLSIASRNCKRLSLLINDLLDLSKLEAGKMHILPVPTSIEKVIVESIEGLNAWAGAKSVKLATDIAPNLPPVKIDPDKIIQVLNNLIGNAIKFTPANGTITAEVKMHNDQEVMVSIQDTGIGIPQDELEKVFDKFYQTGERVATDVSGTGIGLAIAKEIVTLHGGKIWAQSPQGAGAKFSFTIPVN